MQEFKKTEAAALELCTRVPMLDLVKSWAAINSGSRNLSGLKTMANALADAFSTLPATPELKTAYPQRVMLGDGSFGDEHYGDNLHLKVRPEAPVQLLFTGHMDTVFAADHPFQDVAMRADGTLGGPGVADMKGGLAVMLAALSAIEASELAERIGYEVVINSDEEIGSPGSAALIAEAAKGKRAALTYEPAALPDGTLAGARAGSGNFSIHYHGVSAHAGRNPEDGRNAVLGIADLAQRFVDRLKGPGFKVNPAKIEGGSPNNVVPDNAVLRINFRPQTPADVVPADFIGNIAWQCAEQHEMQSVRVDGQYGRPPKPLDAAALKLFELVKSCGADLGQTIGWVDSGGVCDGNNIAAVGVPVVDTMGVRGGAIHSADEYLIVPSLVERAQLSALVILRLATGDAL